MLAFLAVGWIGCAHPATVRPAEHEPEIVYVGKMLKVRYADVPALYRKGHPCAGPEDPTVRVGAPDHQNVMQMGRDRVVTYGYSFPEGTILIRCRADHVEVCRSLR